MLNGQPLPQRSPKLHSSGTICVHSAARSHSGGVNSQRGEEAWPQDPSARAIGTERGCVEDQPQRVGSSKASEACRVLRLVEDDTTALRLQLSLPRSQRVPPRSKAASPLHCFISHLFCEERADTK